MEGADVMHPAPGAEGRPSFTTLVSSIDSMVAKYIALSRVQTGRQELIDDLEEMCKVHFHFTIHVDCLLLKWFDIIGSLGKGSEVSGRSRETKNCANPLDLLSRYLASISLSVKHSC